MRRAAVLAILLGCADSDDMIPVFVDVTGDTGAAEGPLPESRVRVLARFRHDARTGLPGLWFDESSGSSTSAIDFIVADDVYNGVTGLSCRVLVPISPVGATRIGGLASGQYWGVSLQFDPEGVTTNCDEPEYQRIWDFYGGRVTEFLTTDRDGSPAEFGLIIEEPSPSAVAWLTGAGQILPEEVIGGTIRVSDRWSFGTVTAVATRAFQTDENGTLVVDQEGANLPILLEDVAEGSGITEGLYDLIGFQFVVFRAAQ
ncbi:MAG: hypothetical protein AAF602_04750 [Myxococcota bacterium]